MPDPDPAPKSRPEPVLGAKPRTGASADPASSAPVAADPYTELPRRSGRRPRWALWAAVAAALALSVFAARRAATPPPAAPASAAAK